VRAHTAVCSRRRLRDAGANARHMCPAAPVDA
jgi:hypothetical protein